MQRQSQRRNVPRRTAQPRARVNPNTPNQPSTRRRKPLPNRRKRRAPATGDAGLRLSQCARDYAAALADPVGGPLACLPIWPALLTRKFRTFAKGQANTGTNGFGFVIAQPWFGSMSDQVVVQSTDANFTGTTAAGIVTVGTGVNNANSNSDYVAATFAAGALQSQFRLVVGALRVRYVGTELNRGGDFLGYCDPNHSSVVGMNPTNFLANTETVRSAVNQKREWHMLTATTAISAERDFQTQATIPSAEFMGFILVPPTTAVGLPIDWEFYGLYEATGTQIRGKSVSHADTHNFEHINTAANNVITRVHTGSGVERMSSILNTAAHGARAIAPIVSGVGRVASAGSEALEALGPLFGILGL